jgi:hypothetical protein
MGHAIQQMAVMHSTDQAQGTPQLSAQLEVVGMAPTSYRSQFFWASSSYVPNDTVDIHKLMSETNGPNGPTYPNAFTVEADKTYTVTVQLINATVQGVQVTYE